MVKQLHPDLEKAYKQQMKKANQIFKDMGLQFEMRAIKDKDNHIKYKLYQLPCEGRAKVLYKGLTPGQVLEQIASYQGPDRDKLKAALGRWIFF